MSFMADDLVRAEATGAVFPRATGRVRDYLSLTRPRVLSLVLLTAPPALALGAGHWPHPVTAIGVLAGCALIGAGCGALNAWCERDRDARMERTRDRPLPAGRLAPAQALGFGVLVSTLGLLTLLGVGGWLPMLVGAATLAHYIAVYTVWLKPRSAHNTLVGGAAGAAAPLIADAAVDGRIGPWGLVLFAIVFLWQPPHVWAIALYRKQEYAAAGFRMMPSVVGDRATRRRMLAFALVLVPVTLLPWIGGVLGPVYAATATAGGAYFVASILRSLHAGDHAEDRRVFGASLVYLTLLFAVMLAELILR
jgi:protoheme IX farnesyltransferase